MLLDASVVCAVWGGGEGEVSFLCCFACPDQIVLFSIQMMSSASIGVDVTVTGAVGVGFHFFGIGDSGGGNSGIVPGCCCGFVICILKERAFALWMVGSSHGS